MAKRKVTGTIKSLYAGTIERSRTRLPVCETVGQLRRALEGLPEDLPVSAGMGDGCHPVWFNLGGRREPGMPEKLRLQEPDWDD